MSDDNEKKYVYMRSPEDYGKWLDDHGAEWMAKAEKNSCTRYVLKNFQCPGDILMLSACVRDIKRWRPDIAIDIRTSHDELFYHNPHITKLEEDDPSVMVLDMHYEIIHQSNQDMNRHFIHGFIIDFNEQTGSSIKLTEFKPDVHLTDEEKDEPVFSDLPDKFVLLNSGGKTDYTTKWWWAEAWKEVIKLCKDVQFVQVGKRDHKDDGAGKAIHDVIKAKNVISKIDETSIRDVMRLVHQSVGTLSVVTTLMHLAAAFNRHSCVIAGGHEPWWWEKYPDHDYFHSIGLVDCCRTGGCWKKECENTNSKGHQKCLELVSPKAVADSISAWFE